VDDLMPDKDGRSEPLERELDDLDRAIDARAEAARSRDEDAKGRK
jgi:iron uptake system EfeUOB component EfeO/EfeM